MPVIRDPVADLGRLIDLWDKGAEKSWRVPESRHGTNVGMINAYVAHTVNLGRGVRAMYKAGLSFEAVSLVRSSMESCVTACWLAVYPQKTPQLIHHSAQERLRVLSAMAETHPTLDRSSIDQIEALPDLEGPTDPEARWLKSRFESLSGGQKLYSIYRALCTWDHATNSLADAYLVKVEESRANPWGLVLRDRASDELQQLQWAGIQAALVLRAQMAADMVLEKPRHKTQLATWAKRFGVASVIEPAHPAP